MKIMPNIRFSREELERIIFEERSGRGSEAIVCSGGNPYTLYKIFINSSNMDIANMSDNKLRKIAALYRLRLAHSVRPLSTISMDGEVVGYEMTYNPNYIPIAEATLPRKQMIKVLKETSAALEYFSSKDITYGDVKNDNVLIDIHTGQIEFCDMDNIRLGDNPIDLMNSSLSSYVKARGAIDATADAYMHNLFALKELGFPSGYTTYEGIIMALEKGEYPTKFKEKARPIFESMTTPQEFNGEYAIEYIKR